MYLIDTDILIFFLKGRGGVAKRLQRSSPEELGISTISLFELEVGIERSRQPADLREQLRPFLQMVQILPFCSRSAYASARIRAEMERLGTPIGALDYLIAGTAIAHRAILVTHNVAEFSRIPHLQIEDWYDAP